MKRTLLLILSIFLLTAQAEEIDTPLVHAEEYPSGFVADEDVLAVDISPVITFQTDEAGVFAVVVLSSSEELPTPDPSITPAPSIIPTVDEVEEETEEPETVEVEPEEISEAEPEETAKEPAAFLVTTHSTPHSITYTLTSLPPEEGAPQ